MNKKNTKFHYAWVILMCCCMIQGVGIGIISNCAGIYYTPICEELGFSMGRLTFFKTLSGIFSIASMLMAPKLFKKFDVRVIGLGLIFVAGGANFLMGFGTKLWHWYALGIMQGCALTAFSHFLPVSVLNNWFTERIGFAMGVSAASSGALGMIMSRLLTAVMKTYGWRTSMHLNGILCVGLTAPFILFLLRLKPEDKGMEPYGGPRESTGSSKEAERSNDFRLVTISFLMICVYAVCAKATIGFGQYLSGYGESVSALGAHGSMLLTLYLFGNMVFKFVFGYLNDRLGVFRNTLLELVTVFSACGLMLIHKAPPMYIGAVLFGTCAMMGNVQMPLIVRNVWSKEQFSRTYASVAMLADASYYLSITLFGIVYDYTGRYEPVLVICMACAVLEVMMVCCLFLGKSRKEKQARVRSV